MSVPAIKTQRGDPLANSRATQDIIDFETSYFWYEINEVVIRFFDVASVELDRLEKKYWKHLVTVHGNDERGLEVARWQFETEKEHSLERRKALGSLALDYLASALKKKLHQLKRVGEPIVLKEKTYPGKGWLQCVKNEYQQRFGIEFEKSPVPYSRIQEIVLARNAGVHRENRSALTRYRSSVENPRFARSDGVFYKFVVTRDTFCSAVGDATTFVSWVGGELKRFRTVDEVK